MSDRLASLFIQFCAQNGGTLSVRKREQFFPGLGNDELAELERAIAVAEVPGSYSAVG